MASTQAPAEAVPGRFRVHGVTRDACDNHVLACTVEGAVDFVLAGFPLSRSSLVQRPSQGHLREARSASAEAHGLLP
jgi:hypothetical protein